MHELQRALSPLQLESGAIAAIESLDAHRGAMQLVAAHALQQRHLARAEEDARLAQCELGRVLQCFV